MARTRLHSTCSGNLIIASKRCINLSVSAVNLIVVHHHHVTHANTFNISLPYRTSTFQLSEGDSKTHVDIKNSSENKNYLAGFSIVPVRQKGRRSTRFNQPKPAGNKFTLVSDLHIGHWYIYLVKNRLSFVVFVCIYSAISGNRAIPRIV